MITALLATTIFLAAFLTAENLVTTIAGFIVTAVGTSWIKGKTGVYGLGALFLAIVISIIVASVSIVISAFFNGGTVSWETLPQMAAQIFALATIAYKLVAGDTTDSGN